MKDILKIYNISKKNIPDMIYTTDTLTYNEEGFSSFMAKASSFFKKKLENIAGVFGLNSKNDTKEISKEVNVLYKDIKSKEGIAINLVKKGDDYYKTIGGILLPWIPGVEPNLYTLLTGIKIHISNINTVALPLLEDVDTFLKKLNADKEFRTSIIPNKELGARLSSYKNEIDKFLVDNINGRLLQDSREFKDIIPNMSSIETIHNTILDIITVKDIENVQKIFNLSSSIAEAAQQLYKATNYKEHITISKVRAQELGFNLQESAVIVTDVAALIRILDASIRVYKAILEKFEKIK